MWIEMSERKPENGEHVIYFFYMVGVHRGQYYHDKDPDGYWHDVFVGKNGFLSDDVTHWMPDIGQELPSKPRV